MLKRIVQISFLAFLAWVFRYALNTILPFPTESMVEGFLDLSNSVDLWFFVLCRYIVWIVFLALLFKYTRPFLSFVLPISRRYGTTKPIRRFQNFALVFWVILIAGILGYVSTSIAFKNDGFEQFVIEENKSFRDSINTVFDINPINRRMDDNRRSVVKIFRGRNVALLTTSEVWGTNIFSKIEGYPERIKESFGLNFYSLLKEKEIDLSTILSIIRSKKYKNLYYAQKKLSKEKVDLLNRKYRLLGASDESQYEKNVEVFVRDRAKSRYDEVNILEFRIVKEHWKTALIITLIAGALLFALNRSFVGKQFDKLLQFFQQGRFGLGGSARFAGMFEEWALDFSYQKQSLYMGRSLYKRNLTIGLEDPRHMLTIAGTRAGKGATAIIPNLIFWGGSTLVIDPKGANATVTAMRRKNALKQNVHIIDPFHIVDIPDDERACLNPLELLDINSPSIREQINIIAEAIVVPDQNQKEKHWDDGAKTVIAGLIAHLISSDKYENPALHHLRDLISCMPEEQDVLWAEMSMNDKAGRLAKDAANRVIRGINTNEISSILSNADKHTEWLSSPAMTKILGSSTFQFSEMKDKPTTIYLVLPPEYLETHNRFLRLFINLAINQMSIGGRSKVPVMLMLDEFLALGRMEEVEKAFGLMAGYNLTIWPFVQDLGRLRDLYGKSVNAFIANSRAVQVFGVNDEETKEFVSKAIGNRKLDVSIVGNGNNKYTSVKLRDETEVGLDIAADTGRQYILRAGKTPLVIEKTPYYSDQLFAGKFTPDPDYKK